MSPGLKESPLDARTTENSVAVLKRIRDAHQGQLDTSVIAEIDAVIALLEKSNDIEKLKAKETLGFRVLTLIADLVRLLTNVSELMK